MTRNERIGAVLMAIGLALAMVMLLPGDQSAVGFVAAVIVVVGCLRLAFDR